MKEVRVKRKEHIEELRGCGRKKIERALGREVFCLHLGWLYENAMSIQNTG